MKKDFVRVVQITDTHLFKDKETVLLGVRPNESFKAVVNLLQNDAIPPDAILHTGDMSQDETPESYQYFAETIALVPAPLYYLPGNHDAIANQTKVFPSQSVRDEKQIILQNWQLILLNSQKPGEIPGELAQQELDYLESCLSTHSSLYTLVALHHNPISGGRSNVDEKHMLQNPQALLDILKKYPNVRIVLFGHIHQDFVSELGGIKFFAGPSTWVQFNPRSVKFALDNLPQGYRWFNLYEDGKFKTGIKRLPKYIGNYIEDPDAY